MKYRVKLLPKMPEKYYKERKVIGEISAWEYEEVKIPEGTKAIKAIELMGNEYWEVRLECLGEEITYENEDYEKKMKRYEKDLKEYREYEKAEEERLRKERRRLYNELKEEFGE